jgi:hypothetical protein
MTFIKKPIRTQHMSCSSSWTGELPPKAVNGCFCTIPSRMHFWSFAQGPYISDLPANFVSIHAMPYLKMKTSNFSFCIQPNLVSLCTIESNVKVALQDQKTEMCKGTFPKCNPGLGYHHKHLILGVLPPLGFTPHTLKDLIKRLIIQLANFTLYYHSTFAASTHVSRMIN